jgi:hypothetical protein
MIVLKSDGEMNLIDPKAKLDSMKGVPFAKKSCLTAQFRLRIRQLIYVSISSYNRKEHA